ncbi:DUF2336 domain-containing protein [Ferrovibrio sp.]|uniref:DUF2336 domain-containing protein n=1 Tax=Ferrovibrio sp. TaxID=1917215 RepID=UPI0025C0BEA2|nr:DUF2336 domain-containing protein [Ferrovibrio sp.]MBX3455408.1 DUF2336 domain-containing protein [Ferrovibrio sp.]
MSMDYESAKALATSKDAAVRLALAQSQDMQPEILYFLAVDEEADVRRAIAANLATPAQAHLILANDSDEEVRASLADKVAHLLPEMPADEVGKAREYAIQTVEMLARDELTRIRATLSEALKSAVNVPHHVVKQLAQDVELIVSAPVLEFSPLLTDEDLREIVAGAAQSGALSAIARRIGLSAGVADSIVATRDVSAVAALLANDSAQIREETLDLILDAAPSVEAWHEPLVQRPNLPVMAAKRIAGFVAESLLARLAARTDLPEAALAEITAVVNQRLELDEKPAMDRRAAPRDETTSPSEAEALVKRLIKEGKLDNDRVQDAIERSDRHFVLQAIAQAGKSPIQAVTRAFESKNGRLITALVWRAKFSMRTAVMAQRDIAKVPPKSMLNARNGTDYPLSKAELEDQLRILGL